MDDAQFAELAGWIANVGLAGENEPEMVSGFCERAVAFGLPLTRGAVLIESCVPPAEFGGAWPAGVPVQVHGMDADPIFAGEGDLDAARELVAEADDAELFVYPGDRHLFVDGSLASYDADAAGLLTQRVLDLLARV